MSQVAVIARPRSSEVREFAIKNGLAQPGQGRLSYAAVEAFNKSRRGVHRYVRDEPVKSHTVKGPRGGAMYTRNYRVSEARAWAVQNGFTHAGARGRIPSAALDAYVLFLVSQ